MHSTPPPSVPPQNWFRRILLLLSLLALTLAFAGFLYENISEERDQRFNPPQGRFYDVGGYKMHMDCTGEGGPTVILDSGLGDSYLSWRKVQPEISKFVRVCSYDRAGLGYSDTSPRVRTSRVIAEELHSLLQAARIPPPYILVGHSMAGYDVRLFTSLYRGEVAGVVLVDSSHPDQDNRFPPALKNLEATQIREGEFLAFTMPFGLPRLLALCDPDPVQRAAECNFHNLREDVAEFKAFPESAAQTAASGSLGDIPLIVLSHDPDKPSAELPADLAKPVNDAWEQMQEDLVRLSSKGVHTVAKNSAHYIQIDRPDVVIEALRGMVEQLRQHAS